MVHENAILLSELPTAALANEAAFRDYLTGGVHRDQPFTPSVFDLSARAIDDLSSFLENAHFDMDVLLFDDFNKAFRRHHPWPPRQ